MLLEIHHPDRLRRAWGPGAEWALAHAGALTGLDDDPTALVPAHPVVERAVARLPGLRIGSTGAVLEALVPAILEQKVTGDEARHVYRGLIARYGEDAPGPPGLRLQPAPEVLAALPYHAFHPLGLERRRAELIRAVCREAPRAGATGHRPGTGPPRPPTCARPPTPAPACVPRDRGVDRGRGRPARAFGDPDAVSVGDFHTPNMVAWTLAGEPRGTDERMLELLEPYRGQRGRVVRLLELSGMKAPRYGPRLSPRRIDDI